MLEIHTADRAEALADLLVGVLALPPADPFAPDWVAVPSIGMRRWLSQRLARRLGATGRCHRWHQRQHRAPVPGRAAPAGARCPTARRGGVRPHRRRPPSTIPGRSTGSCGRCSPCSTRPAADPLLARLADVPPGATLLGRARRLADLLDRYAVHRPQLLLGLGPWLRPRPRRRAPGRRPALAAPPLPPGASQIGRPSPPERLPGLLDAIVGGTLDLALPRRVALFGLSTLPPDLGPHARGARGRAGRCGCSRWCRSPALARSSMLAAARRCQPPGDEHSARSWSFPRKIDPTVGGRPPPAAALVGPAGPRAGRAAGCGGRRRSAVSMPEPSPRSWPTPCSSGCSSTSAQRGAGRDPSRSARRRSQHPGPLVLGLRPARSRRSATRSAGCSAADATLTEGDIVVISPTARRLRPADRGGVRSVGGGPAGVRPAPTARPRCATASPTARCGSATRCWARSTRCWPRVGGRFTASAVTDVLSLDPVRHRFGLAPDDLSLLDRWIGETQHPVGARRAAPRPRGGSPPTSRPTRGRPVSTSCSWASRWPTATRSIGPGDVVPMPVEGSDAVVAGKMARAVRTLGAVADAPGRAPRHQRLVRRSRRTAADLLFAVPSTAVWQRRGAGRAARPHPPRCHPRGRRVVEPPAVARPTSGGCCQQHLEGDPARAAFGSGAITLCSMLPAALRAAPGGLHPRSRPGLDAPGRASRVTTCSPLQPDVGDREPRAEARQLLLEARARRPRHGGRSPTPAPTCAPTSPRRRPWSSTSSGTAWPPPSVWPCPTCSATLRVDHPRQAFDPVNFEAPPRSFDPIALAGARAFVQRPSPWSGAPTARAHRPRPDRTESPSTWSTLRQFLRHPIRAFFQRRLEVRLPRDEPGAIDVLAVKPRPARGLGAGRGSARLGPSRGRGRTCGCAPSGHAGAMPPASLGVAVVTPSSGEVAAMVTVAAERAASSSPPPITTRSTSSVSGLRLVGSVGPVRAGAATRTRHVQLLAGQAVAPPGAVARPRWPHPRRAGHPGGRWASAATRAAARRTSRRSTT